jgi:hypothetical protein
MGKQVDLMQARRDEKPAGSCAAHPYQVLPWIDLACFGRAFTGGSTVERSGDELSESARLKETNHLEDIP